MAGAKYEENDLGVQTSNTIEKRNETPVAQVTELELGKGTFIRNKKVSRARVTRGLALETQQDRGRRRPS